MGDSIDAIEELKENDAYGVAEGGNLSGICALLSIRA